MSFYNTTIRNCAFLIGLAGCVFGLGGCDMFEYTPYEVRLPESERNLTQKNKSIIERIHVSDEDTLYFVLTADTQGFYEATQDMVSSINKLPDIRFMLHAGDVTDFGLQKEYRLMHDILKKTKVPYLTVVGNHDCVANGKEVYQSMYGVFNYSFTVGQNKFIMLNTNSLEFDDESVPDLEWLENELAGATGIRNLFVVSHIPPDGGEFAASKRDAYAALMRKYNVKMSIHGHDHSYEFEQIFQDGIDYLVIGSASKRYYVLMKVYGEKVWHERIYF